MTSFKTLDDVNVSGKRVLLRVDLNVPMEEGRVSDATRIERVLPTIREIADKGGKVILLAHFGRPKGAPNDEDRCAPSPRRSKTCSTPGGVRQRLRRRPGGASGRRDEGRRRAAARKHPLP